jgi:hypothetical protein
MDLVSSVSSLSYIILLIVGLALVFYGRAILKSVAFLIGAIIGATLALNLAEFIHPFVDDYIGLGFCLIIAVILGAIIGGYLGMAFLRWMIAIFMGGIGYMIAAAFFDPGIIPIIVGIVVFAIILIMFDKFLSVITAMFGAFLAGVAVMNLTEPFIGAPLAFVVFIVLAGLLAYYGAKYQTDQD